METLRTFKNWADFGVLVEKIKEQGEWGQLEDWSAINSFAYTGEETYTEWIIDKIRFPEMVFEAIQAGVIGGIP
jgi:hypothetical protein